MARNVYGLDLGTYDIKIFDKKKDRIWHAKNVIAMKDKKYILSPVLGVIVVKKC
jgi:rod shape-determining protein MreB